MTVSSSIKSTLARVRENDPTLTEVFFENSRPTPEPVPGYARDLYKDYGYALRTNTAVTTLQISSGAFLHGGAAEMSTLLYSMRGVSRFIADITQMDVSEQERILRGLSGNTSIAALHLAFSDHVPELAVLADNICWLSKNILYTPFIQSTALKERCDQNRNDLKLTLAWALSEPATLDARTIAELKERLTGATEMLEVEYPVKQDELKKMFAEIKARATELGVGFDIPVKYQDIPVAAPVAPRRKPF